MTALYDCKGITVAKFFVIPAIPNSLFILLTFFLCGCTSMQQTRVGVVYDFMSEGRKTTPCYESIKNNPRYAELHQKLAVDSGLAPTQEQLADPTIPTPEMIQLGMTWYAENESCNVNTLQIFSNMSPEFGTNVADWLTEVTEIMQDTMAGNRSYGYINNRIQHLYARKKEDTKQWIINEANRRQNAIDQSNKQLTDVALTILDTAFQVLAARQNALAQTQQVYVVRVPVYQPTRITRTQCSRNNFGVVNCFSVSM